MIFIILQNGVYRGVLLLSILRYLGDRLAMHCRVINEFNAFLVVESLLLPLFVASHSLASPPAYRHFTNFLWIFWNRNWLKRAIRYLASTIQCALAHSTKRVIYGWQLKWSFGLCVLSHFVSNSHITPHRHRSQNLLFVLVVHFNF